MQERGKKDALVQMLLHLGLQLLGHAMTSFTTRAFGMMHEKQYCFSDCSPKQEITTFHPAVTINRLSTTLNRFNSGSNSSSNLNRCSLGSEPKMDGDAPVALLLVPISTDMKDGGS
jgi:hypothetical protein